MREIKFRQRVQNSWHYWGFVDDHGYLIFKGIEGSISSIEEAFKNSQQFTGLLDKNGKEIYEGDIFENLSGRGIIEWWPEHCCFSARKVGTDQIFMITSLGHTFATEVIGNIHDNPELIGGGSHETNKI